MFWSDTGIGLAIAIKDDLDRVQAFFLRQYMFIESKLDSLCVAYSFSTTDVSRFREEIISLGPHRANNLLWALIAIFRSYEKLRWYAAVNAHGLRRILAKFSARGFVLNDIPQLDGSPGTSRGFLSYAACSRDLQTLAALIDNFKSLYPTLCHVVPHEHCLEGTFTHEKCLEGIPPLVYAMQTGDLNDIRTMLERPRNLQRELDRGRTALHVAAREGRHDLLRLILESNGQLLNVINVPEPQLGLTPLMIGCIHGHLEVIKQLLAYHVDHTAVDSRGWTAKEHAAFRGHLDVARMLPTATRVDRDDRSHPSLDPYPSDELPIALEKASGELDQNQIILTLGPANTRDPSKPVELHQVLFPPYNLYPDAGFSLVIVPINAKGERFITRLPLLHNTTNDPWTLRTADPETVQLTFHLHQETGRTTKHVATGVFDFSSQKQRDSTGKEGLMRDRSVSMLATDLKSVAATVTFSYLVARPYKGRTSKADPEISHGFWNTGGPTNVVGHRGSGANTTSRTNLQLGENTVDSLASACDLGASGVEFDVQLTKDLVPVIYHNFLVMETGGETTIWNLNEDQFINLSESQASAGALTNMPEVRYRSRNGESSIRPRSHSMDLYDDHRITDMVDRMKRTAEGKSRGIKGNLRGHAIQSMFPKFIELLTRLPESVAFDVEMSKSTALVVGARLNPGSRVPHAMGSSRSRVGPVHDRCESFRRHHPGSHLRVRRQTQHYLLVL